jgi:hypothetical protein
MRHDLVGCVGYAERAAAAPGKRTGIKGPLTPALSIHKRASAEALAKLKSSRSAGENAPSRIRTCGLLLRRESLYPAELSGLAGETIARVTRA